MFHYIYPLEVIDTLANKNKHPRDDNISFDPIPHKYTIKEKEPKDYISVTTWIHSHFDEFNSDLIIDKMFSSKKWNNTHKYWGKSREEIKALWEKNRDEAANSGTNMHYRIETFNNINVYSPNPPSPHQNSFINEKTQEISSSSNIFENNNYKTLFKNYIKYCKNNYSPENREICSDKEWLYFLNFVQDHKELIPYRTEWTVYHEELQLAGSIDMVYELEDGSLAIYDWKRSKEIIKNSPYNKTAITKCISHIPDTNYWHYTLQLNIYKMILETKYNKHVSRLCLVILHPNNENYMLYYVPTVDKEIKLLYENRLTSILS